MQVWVSFIAGFVLISQVSMHTFGLVQSKLFPFYFYCLLGADAVNLAIYAVYHPRELLDWHEGIQTLALKNTIWPSGVSDEVRCHRSLVYIARLRRTFKTTEGNIGHVGC
uniref:Transmembrane protein 205 n=1 Tax=Sinocyclocheilus anshuiensis TaxID=1608454 RepID=A0A671T6Q3_9TELE